MDHAECRAGYPLVIVQADADGSVTARQVWHLFQSALQCPETSARPCQRPRLVRPCGAEEVSRKSVAAPLCAWGVACASLALIQGAAAAVQAPFDLQGLPWQCVPTTAW